MAQPHVMTIQPEFWALDLLSRTADDAVAQENQERGPDYLPTDDVQKILPP